MKKVARMSTKEYRRLEREVKILRKHNEELQALLEGIYENEKIGETFPWVDEYGD